MSRHEPRIAISAASATAGGGLSVARNLAGHLAAVRPEWAFDLFISKVESCPETVPDNLEVHLYAANAKVARRLLWDQTTFPEIERESKIDASILLGGFASLRSSVPQIAVWQNANIWAASPPERTWKLSAFIAVQKQVMRLSVQRARHNVFLTQNSIEECARAISLPRKNCVTIPIGLEPVFLSNPPLAPQNRRAPIVLAVGDQYTHKRFELIIEALEHLLPTHPTLELQIAGRPIDVGYHDFLRTRIAALGLQDRVVFLGGVSTANLIELYDRALVFVTASSLETFGLTPLESMARGLPVVATRDSATPEVCGDAALYCESTSEGLASCLSGLVSHEQDWQTLHEKGLARAHEYAWPDIAERYAQLIAASID